MKSFKTIGRNLVGGVLVGAMLFFGLMSFVVVANTMSVHAEGECDSLTGPAKEKCEADAADSGGGSGAGSGAAASACEGVSTLGVTCGTAGDAKSVISGPVKTIIQLLSFVVGVASIVMIIYGGFRFITSGGNSDATKSARNTIIYALVGLLIVLIANLLITFVFNQAKELNGASGGGAGGSSGCVSTEAVPCPTSPPTTD